MASVPPHTKAAAAAAAGDAAFSAGKFAAAAPHYTAAIAADPSNPSLHSRLGAARLALGDTDAAVAAYSDALALDPDNANLKSALADAQSAAARGGSTFGAAFQSPDLFPKLAASPVTSVYLHDPEFVRMVEEVRDQPAKLLNYTRDERMVAVLRVLADGMAGGRGTQVVELEVEMDLQKAMQAQFAREEGNEAYKRREFGKAIECYTRAMELDGDDIAFWTNRAAAYLEIGMFDKCIQDCDEAVERGRELDSDSKLIARALTRKGTALVQLARCSKDYEPAIETFQKALTVHGNPDIQKKLNYAERAKKELELQEYLDELTLEERKKGNQLFIEQKYTEAANHYTGALRRNPRDAKLYSSRAACYINLGLLPEAIKDSERCIELNPTLAEGYLRKGEAQFLMKEYEKALETYEEGVEHDPSSEELVNGFDMCIEHVKMMNKAEITPEELNKRKAKAMQDPEMHKLLIDPSFRQVLVDFQQNPSAAMEHLKSPEVMRKMRKLMCAGIIQMF